MPPCRRSRRRGSSGAATGPRRRTTSTSPPPVDSRPTRVEVSVDVPVRVCDVGGWTDTWFAGHGRVCSLAAGPGVVVTATACPGAGQVTFDLTDYDTTFSLEAVPPEHRLLAAAVAEAGEVAGVDVTLRIGSAVPPGSSLGTSAAVCVGVVAALDALREDRRPPEALA